MGKVKCNLSNEELWKRLDKMLLKMAQEKPVYSEAQEQYKEKSEKILEVLREALGHRPGFELYFWMDSARLDMSVVELETAYMKGYKDAMKAMVKAKEVVVA